VSTQPFNIADDMPLEVGPADGQPVAGASFMRDTSPPLDVATFNPVAWVQGMRPTRRTVKLYLANHLVGALDELADRIDSAPDGADVSADIAEFERIRDEYWAGVTYWTVERRSSEWVTKCWEDVAQANRIRLDKGGDTTTAKDRVVLILHQLVGQIVEVKSADGQVSDAPVTYDLLHTMLDRNEGELNKLIYALTDVNQRESSAAQVLTRDFSQRSSTARSGTAS
jgi:hypothetical protein